MQPAEAHIVVGEKDPRLEAVDVGALDERYGELRLRRPGAVAALRRSIEREGLLEPLLVNLEPEGRLSLVDGFKRRLALGELGIDRVLAWVVQLDAAAVRVAIVTRNAPHRGLCELEQAWVVHALVRGCRLSQSRVGVLLGRHKSWVCRRLMMAERLEASLQDDMRMGLVSASLARELVRLPRGNQTPVALALRGHGFSVRRARTIVDRALRCRNEAELTALLRDPWRPAVAADDRSTATKALDHYLRASRELRGVLEGGVPRDDEVASRLAQALEASKALLTRLEGTT